MRLEEALPSALGPAGPAAFAPVVVTASARARASGVAYFDVEAPTTGQPGTIVARGRGGGDVAHLRFELTGSGRGTFATAGFGADLQGTVEIAKSQDGTVSVVLTLNGQQVVLTTGAAGASEPITLPPEGLRLLGIWGDLLEPLQTIARASVADSEFRASFARWSLAACGITWLGVSVGVGVCATGQLSGCATALAGAAVFAENC